MAGNKRIVEGIYKSVFNNNPQARQYYQKLKNVNPQEAQQYINSIFTETMKTVKDVTKNPKTYIAGVIGLPSTASAAEVAKTTADKGADFFVPFYSATKSQIQAVNDYLDGRISKDEYYKKIGEGALGQAVDAALVFIGGKAGASVAKKALKPIISKVTTTLEKSGINAAMKVGQQAMAKARNEAVKTVPKAAEQIKQGVTALRGSIDDVINKVAGKTDTIDLRKMNSEQIDKFFMDNFDDISLAQADKLGVLKPGQTQLDESFRTILRNNAEGIKGLANAVGVKSAKELPNVIKFAKQLGSIIENSPANIKKVAQGKGATAGIIANTGLSVYDLYQAFKEGGDNLIPRSIGDITRGVASTIPGGFVAKLLYGALGYSAGDKLSRAGLQKLGVKPTTSDVEQREIEQGIRQPGLSEELGEEYLTGQSGRKYHVVNDKIYDFATGKPVNIQQALQDADAQIQTQLQLTQDQLNAVNGQIEDLENAANMGYNITPEQLEPLYQQREALTQQSNQLGQLNFTTPDYNSEGDLVEQFRQREVVPMQQQQQQQAQVQHENLLNAYNQIFEKIAQDTYNDLDNYYTPEQQAVNYYQYQLRAGRGEVPFMSAQEFSNYAKGEAMNQLAPKMRENAQNMLKSLLEQEQKRRDYELNVRKQNEVERAGRAGELIDAYKAEETRRHNLQTEGTDVYKAQTGRQTSNASMLNAITNQQELGIKQEQLKVNQAEQQRRQQLLPYQQAEAAGAALSGASMSGMDLDTFINSNQSIMPQVFPEAFKQQEQQPVQQNQSNFNLGNVIGKIFGN